MNITSLPSTHGDPTQAPLSSTRAIERLTALWALNEAGLGGLMHALRSPFTGIVVGGTAVLLIALIAHFSSQPGKTLLKSLMLVLLVKFTVSPHAPLPAYVAVSFQGLLGAVVFQFLGHTRLTCLLLGVLALLQSALQKVLVMTIIYGTALWEAIDVFVQVVLARLAWTDLTTMPQASRLLVGTYLLVYALLGVLIGLLAHTLPKQLRQRLNELTKVQKSLALAVATHPSPSQGQKQRNLWRRYKVTFMCLALFSVFFFLAPLLGQADRGWTVLIRALFALLLWYVVLGPFLLFVLKRFLGKRRAKEHLALTKMLALLPHLRQVSLYAFHQAEGANRWRKWHHFFLTTLALALLSDPPKARVETNSTQEDTFA